MIRKLLMVLVPIALGSGIAVLVQYGRRNVTLEREVAQLEAELGRMTIEDPERIYLVAIEQPDVPPEVAEHVDRIWQFRCYLPPKYDFRRYQRTGRVAEEGLLARGSGGSGWSMPATEATHELMTLSIQGGEDDDDPVQLFYSLAGSGGSTTLHGLTAEQLRSESLVWQTLVAPGQPPRSFDQETILPLVKYFDRDDTETGKLNGEPITLYAGGWVVLCPQSRASDMEQLRDGIIPDEFEAESVASFAGEVEQ